MALLGNDRRGALRFYPRLLKAKLNINEIITTLMLNYIAVLWNNYWIFENGAMRASR
jgi:simple sugar transport system permease protein